MAHWYVGTSGWSYPNWAGTFYPSSLPRRDRLAYFAARLPAVEINASFYRLPQENILARWFEATPDSFRFSVKAWRTITHHKRLRNCAEELAAFSRRLDALGSKAPVALYQLPPRFPADAPLLDAFCRQLPTGRRAAIEFRDASWHTQRIYEILAQHNVAFASFELGQYASPWMITADFAYVRLHGREARYTGRYDPQTLNAGAAWTRDQLTENRDVYVFFDNTKHCDDAVVNARTLANLRAIALGRGCYERSGWTSRIVCVFVGRRCWGRPVARR